MPNSSTHSSTAKTSNHAKVLTCQTQSIASPYQQLSGLLKQLKLTHMLSHWEATESLALQQQWSYAQFLLVLCEKESERRYQARQQRALKEALLPDTKSFTNFDFSHCKDFNPAPLIQLAEETTWLDKAQNCLLFGPSGVGKTHLAAAVGRRAIALGKRVKFYNTLALVQQLQQEKQQLLLQSRLKKLDRFDLLILDDFGYVKKSEAETSVLFELVAHRYECKSLLITANQPFSQWDSIFPDSMMTVAAVDRLVHHAIIFELNAQSYRQQAAAVRSSS